MSHEPTTPPETYSTYALICPYCGYVDCGAWELGGSYGSESGETECGSCGKAFVWERHVTVAYTGKVKA